ncbi:MAG TPA: hypothetical protein VK435_11270 [Thermodesulfovibrionales bacterium]|nr:hypothetical protein [Thermodesulfovibrionales bacterium]
MSKLNCWEYKNCGGGTDRCPAMTSDKFDGVNNGKNGGRICWYARDTMADRKEKGPQAAKCAECGFYNQVEREEGQNLVVFF